jgi:hypothetical protein
VQGRRDGGHFFATQGSASAKDIGVLVGKIVVIADNTVIADGPSI